MGLIRDLRLGFSSYIDAVKFIRDNRMWHFFLLPILIFVLIYYIGFTFSDLKTGVNPEIEENTFVKLWYMFVKAFYGFVALVFLNFVRYVLLILISPILSIVSEKVERILTGNVYKFNLPQLIKDIKRAANLSIRNVIWELGIAYGIVVVLWLIFGLAGWDNWFTNFITSRGIPAFIGFYYYGFGFIDYLNERRRLTIPESVKFVRKHRGFAFAIGSVFTIIFVYSFDALQALYQNSSSNLFWFVILISVILSMIPIITMVAATLGVHALVDLKKNPYASKEKPKASTPDQSEIAES